MPQFDTAANIINDAAAELGLQFSDVSAATLYATEEPFLVQLIRLLKGLGQDLAREHDWPTLQKTHTFSTGSGTAAYDVPADYLRTINQTHWNRTDQRPVLGPANAQGWQYLKGVSNNLTVDAFFRIFNNQLSIHPTPTATETVAFEYVSSYWVRRNWKASTEYVIGDRVVNSSKVYDCDTDGTSDASGGPTGTAANEVDGTTRWDYVAAVAGANGTITYPTWGGDTLLFDRRLLVIGLQLYYKGKRGFSALMEDAQFASAFSIAKTADGATPVLSLSGQRTGHRGLGYWNIPDTGYGQ